MSSHAEDIVGGIDALGGSEIDTIIYGGNEVVVGNNAVELMRDRALYLSKDTGKFDDKKILDIIGMSQPLTFGKIESDDGESSYIIPRSSTRTTPEDEMLKSLRARLSAKPEFIVEELIIDFKLNSATWMAMGNSVDSIIARIEESVARRTGKKIDMIYISPSLGEIVAFTKCGKLEVSADDKYPKSFKELISYLLDLCITKKCVSSDKIKFDNVQIPIYPKVSIQVEKDMEIEEKKEYKTIKEIGIGIAMREFKIAPYLADIEKYYVELAHGIQSYTKAIIQFII